MCGIVGYTGNQDAIYPVIEGLTRLEYRGYDSAGISMFLADALTPKVGSAVKGTLKILKKEGKLENLKNLLEGSSFQTSTAIGHTRWATHGKVNDINAHPHSNEIFSIVHNGIIENSYTLKNALIKEGFPFLSETDSEVFLVLLTKIFHQTNDVKSAIIKTFQQLEGNSAFVIMSNIDKSIYALRRGAPLVCGEKWARSPNAQLFISSDPYALVGNVDYLLFPEDNVLCELSDKDKVINFYDLDGKKTEKVRREKQSSDVELSTKGKFEHFMLKEIYEQPSLAIRLLQYYTIDEGAEILAQYRGRKFDHIHIIGCGTAWHAGLAMKDALEKCSGTRVSVELASEFRYRQPILLKNDLCLFISQSGETADTLASAQMAKDKGIHIVSIINVKGSSLYRISDANLLIKAGQEIGVASTKAFTLQAMTGLFLALTLGGKTIDESVKKEVHLFETRLLELLAKHNMIKDIAKELFQQKGFIFIGRGCYYPIALEGALKLKEIAYVHAEGYAAGELKHGPIAIIDESIANVVLLGPELLEKSLSNAEEVKARKGVIFALGQEDHQEIITKSDYFFPLNFTGLKNFNSLYINVALQLFSYEVAKLKGTDIDRPRNLAKSVTVE